MDLTRAGDARCAERLDEATVLNDKLIGDARRLYLFRQCR